MISATEISDALDLLASLRFIYLFMMISSPGKLLTLLFHGLQQNFINNDCFYLKISPSSGIKIKLFLDLHLSVDCDFLSVAALCDFSYCFQEMGLLRGQTYSSAACLRVNSSSLLLL